MLGRDELADVAGDVRSFLRTIDAEDDEDISIAEACERATGFGPAFVGMRQEARLEPVDGGSQVQVRKGTAPERARWLAGHELGEWFYRLVGYDQPDIDARCDAFGAALVCPEYAFRSAMRRVGHRVHELAATFATTQSVALLRVGELSGRPVLLLRPAGAIARGDEFEWPRTSTLVRALGEGRAACHPLRINDEPDRWGLMARR